jgi:hypothetical protein
MGCYPQRGQSSTEKSGESYRIVRFVGQCAATGSTGPLAADTTDVHHRGVPVPLRQRSGTPSTAGVAYSSGFSWRKRRSTLPVILAMLLSYPLWDSDPVQAMEPTEKNPPPPSSAQ